MQRQRRRLLILAAVGALCTALAWAHGPSGDDHMGGDEMAQAISTCLAVIDVGLGLLVGALAIASVRRRRPPRSISGKPWRGAAPPLPAITPIRPRAGPAVLQVFLR